MAIRNYQEERKKAKKIRKAVKDDIKAQVTKGNLPDISYKVSLASNYRGGHRVEGMAPEQALAFSCRHIRIEMKGLPEEFEDLDKQRELRETIYDLVSKYQPEGQIPFGVGVRTFDPFGEDLLEVAVKNATQKVREKNGGKLPVTGLILPNVPHPYWVC